MIHVHRWTNWTDSISGWFQFRYCKKCNKKDRRTV